MLTTTRARILRARRQRGIVKPIGFVGIVSVVIGVLGTPLACGVIGAGTFAPRGDSLGALAPLAVPLLMILAGAALIAVGRGRKRAR